MTRSERENLGELARVKGPNGDLLRGERVFNGLNGIKIEIGIK